MDKRNILILSGILIAAVVVFSVVFYNPGTKCENPYISVGEGCCLDANVNGICDNVETAVHIETTTTTIPEIDEEDMQYVYLLDALMEEGNPVSYRGYTFAVVAVTHMEDSVNNTFIHVEKPDGEAVILEASVGYIAIVDDVLIEIREDGLFNETVLLISTLKE
jgi:hypothetical protein